jgi:predicted anti-sigma-YlaC factor YlaD
MRQWFKKWFLRDGGPMDCHAVGELLQHYLDGHVDAERARWIGEHLEDCRRCGLEAETYERIKAGLAVHRPEVPAESIARLREFGARLARGEESSAR